MVQSLDGQTSHTPASGADGVLAPEFTFANHTPEITQGCWSEDSCPVPLQATESRCPWAEGSVFQHTPPPHPAILVQSRGGCQGPDLQNLQGLLLGPQVVPPAPQGLLPGVQTGVSVQERWPGCLCMSLPPVMETLVFWPGGFGRVPSGAGYQKDSGCEPAWCAVPAQSPRVHPRPIQRCQEGQHQQQRSAWQDARSLGAHNRGKCRQGGKLDTQPPVTQPGQKRSQDPIT